MIRTKQPHALKDRPTAFGRWMTEHRIARGWSMMELASKLRRMQGPYRNIGRFSEWEQGQHLPQPAAVRALHALLDPEGPAPPVPVLAGDPEVGPRPCGCTVRTLADADRCAEGQRLWEAMAEAVERGEGIAAAHEAYVGHVGREEE